MLEYDLMRSKRKTLALYVKQDGSIEVRAPLKTSRAYIDEFVFRKRGWIESTRNRLSARQAAKKTVRMTQEEVTQYKTQAKEYLRLKCRYFSEIMGLRHGEIKINGAKTRWGSCNRKGDVNFTWRLLLAPEELVDYVVVHELAHLKEMNHSDRFWSIVERTMPDYRERREKLRELERRIELVVVSQAD